MTSFQFLILIGLFASVRSQGLLIGDLQPESCSSAQDGFGKPINSFNHAINTIHSFFRNNGKGLELIHFSSQLVAGTIFNSVFKQTVKDEVKFVAIRVFVPLPVYNKEPSVEKMLISDSLEEAGSLIGVKLNEVKVNPSCNSHFTKDFWRFSVGKEMQKVAEKFKKYNQNNTNLGDENKTKVSEEKVKTVSSTPIGIGDQLVQLFSEVEELIKNNNRSKTNSKTHKNHKKVSDELLKDIEKVPADLLSPQTEITSLPSAPSKNSSELLEVPLATNQSETEESPAETKDQSNVEKDPFSADHSEVDKQHKPESVPVASSETPIKSANHHPVEPTSEKKPSAVSESTPSHTSESTSLPPHVHVPIPAPEPQELKIKSSENETSQNKDQVSPNQSPAEAQVDKKEKNEKDDKSSLADEKTFTTKQIPKVNRILSRTRRYRPELSEYRFYE